MKQISKKEILKTIMALEKNNDAVSAAQIQVLENRWSESEVFRKFVVEVPEAERNEDVFFAARDAAMFLAGKLPASAIVPDYDDKENNNDGNYSDDETITISHGELEDILKRLDRLEKKVGIWRPNKRAKNIEGAPDDLMSRKDAAEWIGCNIRTIKRWAKEGAFTIYPYKGSHYYSQSEIKASMVYRDYKTKNYSKKHINNQE